MAQKSPPLGECLHLVAGALDSEGAQRLALCLFKQRRAQGAYFGTLHMHISARCTLRGQIHIVSVGRGVKALRLEAAADDAQARFREDEDIP